MTTSTTSYAKRPLPPDMIWVRFLFFRAEVAGWIDELMDFQIIDMLEPEDDWSDGI